MFMESWPYLRLGEALYTRGSQLGLMLSPEGNLAMSGHSFFSIVPIFYLNLKFSKIIKTEIMKGAEKSRIKHHLSHGNLAQEWQWEQVTSVHLA